MACVYREIAPQAAELAAMAEADITPLRCAHTRRSTDEDIEVIHRWLVRQDAAGVQGTFLCNWGLTLERHKEGELLVYIEPGTGEAVAYQWGSLIRSGILEVRADRRRQGIGEAMVRHRLAEAFDRDEDLLTIQCKPASSVPFWRRMGFETLQGEGGNTYGYRALRRQLNLPAEGSRVAVSIEWLPESCKWDRNTVATKSFVPAAVQTDDGTVHLAERVHAFDGLPGQARTGDVVVRIVVAGEERYFDKAKYDEAAWVGVQRCRNGYYVDSILSDL